MPLEDSQIEQIKQRLQKAAESWGVSFADDALQLLEGYIRSRDVVSHSEEQLTRTMTVLGYCSIGKAIFESLARNGKAVVYPVDVNHSVWLAHENPWDRCFKSVAVVNEHFATFQKILPDDVML